MTFRIEIVDPSTAAPMAGRVLRASWKPPCLDYSDAYLAWQFGFPGRLNPVVALGFLDSQPVGCAAATQRAVVHDGSHIDAYVLSFVAVDPSARGHGLAAALYARLLGALSPEAPVIAFAEPNSDGERLLNNAFDKTSYTRHTLGLCRAVGYVSRPATSERLVSAAAVEQLEDFTSAIPDVDKATIWNRPTPQQWVHYAADPRPRTGVLIRDRDGLPIGSAMIVLTAILSAQGLQQVPMLESVCLPSQSSDALRAVFDFATEQSGAAGTIVASNLSYLDSSVIRAAGARALPSSFNAYVFLGARTYSLQNAAHMNLEVI